MTAKAAAVEAEAQRKKLEFNTKHLSRLEKFTQLRHQHETKMQQQQRELETVTLTKEQHHQQQWEERCKQIQERVRNPSACIGHLLRILVLLPT